MPTPDPYPEHARQSEVLDAAQAIGEFLDNTDYVLAEYRVMDGWPEPRLAPVSKTLDQILADYFGIDLDKIEAEKRAMIAAAAAAYDTTP